MKKSLRALPYILAIIVGTLLTLTVGAAPASADQFTCDSGEYCVWRDGGYGGGIFTTGGSLSNYAGNSYYGNPPAGGPLNDSVSSYCNQGISSGPTRVESHLNSGYSGGVLWIANLGVCGAATGVGNDNSSSHRWVY
jgi:hypothetical protein